MEKHGNWVYVGGYRVAVPELRLGYYDKETALFTIYSYSGNLIQVA